MIRPVEETVVFLGGPLDGETRRLRVPLPFEFVSIRPVGLWDVVVWGVPGPPPARHPTVRYARRAGLDDRGRVRYDYLAP